MDVVLLAGRILFVVVFLLSGVSHFAQREALTQYAKAYKAPAPALLVPLTGAVLVAGSLSVVLGIWADLGALLIVAFLIPTSFFMHAFWKEPDPQQKQNQMAHFMKNLALAGGALVIFYLYNQIQGEAPLSITDPLFERTD